MTTSCQRTHDRRCALSKQVLNPRLAIGLQEELARVNSELARTSKVTPGIERKVERLTSRIAELGEDLETQTDPYLLMSLQHGVIGALRALDLANEKQKRSQLRVALERMRQSLRDMLEGVSASEEQASKDLVRWLVETLDVPQTEIADLLNVNARKLQRWLSPQDPSEPHDEDALRVRLVARITSHLRHGFSGPGVVAWLERPHPELKGSSPKQLLNKRQTFEHLVNLAASARSSAAT